MFKGLLALVDDLAVLSRAAASSLDDVATLTAKAGSKAAGIVVDDAAVTPGYVVGLSADRELKVIWKIAVGSLRNKLLVLLPAALALSYFAPWAIMPLLICGGFFLCFEGAEKILKKVRPKAVAKDETSPEATDPVALENARVKGAITTDFILSAEIMAITLTTVNKETSAIGMRAAVLAAVAVMITVAVYGAVAIIVKADEAGMWLARSKLAFKRALGRGIVRGVPGFMTLLATVGTAAMLWVGGDIVIHGAAELGAPGPERVIYRAAEAAASAVQGAAGLVTWLVKVFFAAVIGVVCGGVVVIVKGAIAPLLAGRKSSAST